MDLNFWHSNLVDRKKSLREENNTTFANRTGFDWCTDFWHPNCGPNKWHQNFVDSNAQPAQEENNITFCSSQLWLGTHIFDTQILWISWKGNYETLSSAQAMIEATILSPTQNVWSQSRGPQSSLRGTKVTKRFLPHRLWMRSTLCWHRNIVDPITACAERKLQ